MLPADGTPEFNYLERRRSAFSASKVVTAWEVAPEGYACSALTSVAGMGNLGGVSLMQFTLNACSGLEELDMRGLDPSGLTNVNYLFGGCSALRTVLVDADWALPKSGLSGMATFYNCKAIVGGNGTAYDSGKTGYAMMRVDTAGSAGYLTAG